MVGPALEPTFLNTADHAVISYWRADTKPDYFCRLAGGDGLVVDVKRGCVP